MSPEQAEGRPVDRRTDIFSFGVVLYEMLTGRRAFQGDTQVTTRAAILTRTPPAVRSIRPDVPATLERVVARCLEKSRDARYPSAVELVAGPSARDARRDGQRPSWMHPRVLVPAAAGPRPRAAAGGWLWLARTHACAGHARSRCPRSPDSPTGRTPSPPTTWPSRRAVPPARPAVRAALSNTITVPRSFRSDPPGAEVSWKPFAHPDAPWRRPGPDPARRLRLPRRLFPVALREARVRRGGTGGIDRAGAADRHAPSLGLVSAGHGLGAGRPPWPPHRRVSAARSRRPWVASGSTRFEVTNRQFKAFVDAGGYRKR